MKAKNFVVVILLALAAVQNCAPAHAAQTLTQSQMDKVLGRGDTSRPWKKGKGYKSGNICADQGPKGCLDEGGKTGDYCWEKQGIPYPICTTDGAVEGDKCYKAYYSTCFTWNWYAGEENCDDVAQGTPTYETWKDGCYHK